MYQFIIIILLIIICLMLNIQEYFNSLVYNKIPESIWWNSTRRTRNMSYDLRGDPIIIPEQQYVWNNSYII